MLGRTDIEGSKSSVAKNALLQQASYPCGNFSDTSQIKSSYYKDHTDELSLLLGCVYKNITNLYPYILKKISVQFE